MPKPSSTVDTQVTPVPTLEKRTRRKCSTEYKLKITQLADACKHGELGPLLRKEKLSVVEGELAEPNGRLRLPCGGA